MPRSAGPSETYILLSSVYSRLRGQLIAGVQRYIGLMIRSKDMCGQDYALDSAKRGRKAPRSEAGGCVGSLERRRCLAERVLLTFLCIAFV